MLTVLVVLLAALIVVGAGELVRGTCRQMLSSPLPAAVPAQDSAAVNV